MIRVRLYLDLESEDCCCQAFQIDFPDEEQVTGLVVHLEEAALVPCLFVCGKISVTDSNKKAKSGWEVSDKICLLQVRAQTKDAEFPIPALVSLLSVVGREETKATNNHPEEKKREEVGDSPVLRLQSGQHVNWINGRCCRRWEDMHVCMSPPQRT